MAMERKLTSIKERKFEFGTDSYTGKSRYLHRLGADEDIYNVKRQFDEILQRYGVSPKEHIRALAGRIIFSETAYLAWQTYIAQEPVRKSRTSPELRMFSAQDNETYVLKLDDETARVVAGTLTSNAKETHNISDINIKYDKTKNEIYIDKNSLADYLKAIQQNKPCLLQNNPDFKKYVDSTLRAINRSASFKKSALYSNAHTMSSFSFRAQKNNTLLQNNAERQEPVLQSEQHTKKLLVPTN